MPSSSQNSLNCKVFSLNQAIKVQQEAKILDLVIFEYLTSQLVCANIHLYTDNTCDLLFFLNSVVRERQEVQHTKKNFQNPAA